MRLAVIEFNQIDIRDGKYIECRLIDPPTELISRGTGLTISAAFEDLRSKLLDDAMQSARLIHSDLDEWHRTQHGLPVGLPTSDEYGSTDYSSCQSDSY